MATSRKSFGSNRRVVSENTTLSFPDSPFDREPRKVSFETFEPAPLPHEPGTLSQQRLESEAQRNNSRASQESSTGVVVGTDYSSGESLVSVPGQRVVRVQANQATQGAQLSIDNQKNDEYERIRRYGTTVNTTSSFSGWTPSASRPGVSTGTQTTTKSVGDIGLLRDDCTPPDVKARIIEDALLGGVFLDAQGNYLGDTVGYGGNLTLVPNPAFPGTEMLVSANLVSNEALNELYRQSKEEERQQQSLPSYLSLEALGGESTVGFTADLPVLWKCDNGLCVQAPDGLYPTKELCESNCGLSSWDCINGTCVSIPGSTGPYRTQDECVSQGCNTRFTCINGEPVPDPQGDFATKEAAIAGGCYWGYGKNQLGECEPQIAGPFKSLFCCQENQVQPAQVYFANWKAVGGAESLGAPVAEPYISQETLVANQPTTIDYSFPSVNGPKEIKYRGTKIPDSYWLLQADNEVRVSVAYSFTATLNSQNLQTGDPVNLVLELYFQETQMAVFPEIRKTSDNSLQGLGPMVADFPKKLEPFSALLDQEQSAAREASLNALLRDADFENLIQDIKPWCRLAPNAVGADWAVTGDAPYKADEGFIAYSDRILTPLGRDWNQGYPELDPNFEKYLVTGTVTGVNGSQVTADFQGSVSIQLPDPGIYWTAPQNTTLEVLNSYRIYSSPGSFILGPYGEDSTYLAMGGNGRMRYGSIGIGTYRSLGHFSTIEAPQDSNYTFSSFEGTFTYDFLEFGWPGQPDFINFLGETVPKTMRAIQYPLTSPSNTGNLLLDPANIWYFWNFEDPPAPWGQWRAYWSNDDDWNPFGP